MGVRLMLGGVLGLCLRLRGRSVELAVRFRGLRLLCVPVALAAVLAGWLLICLYAAYLEWRGVEF